MAKKKQAAKQRPSKKSAAADVDSHGVEPGEAEDADAGEAGDLEFDGDDEGPEDEDDEEPEPAPNSPEWNARERERRHPTR